MFAICLPATRCSLAQSAGREASSKAPLRNMLVINEDNSHFFGTRKPEDMTLAGLHAFVDQYAGSAVTHLFLCPNAMRASFPQPPRETRSGIRSAGNEPDGSVAAECARRCLRPAWTRTRSGSAAAARRPSRRGCPCG